MLAHAVPHDRSGKSAGARINVNDRLSAEPQLAPVDRVKLLLRGIGQVRSPDANDELIGTVADPAVDLLMDLIWTLRIFGNIPLYQ
jgi:hypothetical protein